MDEMDVVEMRGVLRMLVQFKKEAEQMMSEQKARGEHLQRQLDEQKLDTQRQLDKQSLESKEQFAQVKGWVRIGVTAQVREGKMELLNKMRAAFNSLAPLSPEAAAALEATWLAVQEAKVCVEAGCPSHGRAKDLYSSTHSVSWCVMLMGVMEAAEHLPAFKVQTEGVQELSGEADVAAFIGHVFNAVPAIPRLQACLTAFAAEGPGALSASAAEQIVQQLKKIPLQPPPPPPQRKVETSAPAQASPPGAQSPRNASAAVHSAPTSPDLLIIKQQALVDDHVAATMKLPLVYCEQLLLVGKNATGKRKRDKQLRQSSPASPGRASPTTEARKLQRQTSLQRQSPSTSGSPCQDKLSPRQSILDRGLGSAPAPAAAASSRAAMDADTSSAGAGASGSGGGGGGRRPLSVDAPPSTSGDSGGSPLSLGAPPSTSGDCGRRPLPVGAPPSTSGATGIAARASEDGTSSMADLIQEVPS